MRFESIAASPRLSRFVQGYWFVEDATGLYAGQPIQTSPVPNAVLTLNLGRPNQLVGGPLVPKVSLLGLQSAARRWRSWEDTCFVMAILTLAGVVRLFPGLGPASADALVELGTLTGDGAAHALVGAAEAAERPADVARAFDAWLESRLDRVAAPRELSAMMTACSALSVGAPVSVAADRAQISRRQLHRWTRTHFGFGPKTLGNLKRLDSSVRAVQTGRGDPLDGFSDQAHQTRTWRRRLGQTPGRYRASTASPMARTFVHAPGAPAFYL